MKKICAVTRLRNDDFFLRKWVSYYGGQLGEENLYVYFDGKDQKIPDFGNKVNYFLCDRIEGKIVKTDRGRIDFLSARAAELLKKYDLVIGTDIDEFLVVDPSLEMTLPEYLSRANCKSTLSGLGIDVGQDMKTEKPLNIDIPFLSQRKKALINSRYTKASILSQPLNWGAGFHRVRKRNYHIDKNLFLFHFGSADMGIILSRFSDKEKITSGWRFHLMKRTNTIRYVTHLKGIKGDKSLRAARLIQTCFRQIYAYNKPSMAGILLVITIPERFHKVL